MPRDQSSRRPELAGVFCVTVRRGLVGQGFRAEGGTLAPSERIGRRTADRVRVLPVDLTNCGWLRITGDGPGSRALGALMAKAEAVK
jgi:hypothetical protein